MIKLFQKALGGAAKTLRGTLGESFDKTFSKVFRAPAAKRRSPSAEGETSLSAFLFDSFFFAPPSCKEKTAKDAEWAGGYRNTCRKVALFIRRGVL